MSIDETARRAWDPVGAATYDRGRPGYAPGALSWLIQKGVLGPGRQVVDVGAGTGKLTRQLMQTRARVVAVEPLAGMRSLLPARVAVGGLAEALPVVSGWADAVTVGQAFHWFSAAAAAESIHRVLKPGGWLLLLWNDDEPQGDWPDLHARLGALLDAYGIDSTPVRERSGWKSELEGAGLFSPLVERDFSHAAEATLDSLVARLASFSRVATQEPEVRGRILGEARDIIEGHPVMGGKRTALVPYRTTLFSCTRR